MSCENLSMPYVNNKGADQPAHPCSLISVFVIRCLDNIIPLLAIAGISRLQLVSVAEPYLVKTPRDRFSHDVALILLCEFWTTTVALHDMYQHTQHHIQNLLFHCTFSACIFMSVIKHYICYYSALCQLKVKQRVKIHVQEYLGNSTWPLKCHF